MIFEQKKIIFIHYPKTAGNSIQDALRQYTNDKLVTLTKYQDGVERFEVRNEKFKNLVKHSTLNDYYKVLGQEIYSYKIFLTIRNPFDRLVSFYFSPHRGEIQYNREDFSTFIEKVPPLQQFIYFKKSIFEKAEIFKDIKFIRFENINEDFLKICNQLGIQGVTLPHRNASKREQYKSYYDHDLIEKVKKIHKLEISLGNYNF
jgi:hypothetical protein